MTDFESQLRAAMESAVASRQPPGNLVQQVRRRHRRHVLRVAVAGAAAVAVVAFLIPVGAGALGHISGPAAKHPRKAAPTLYVAYAGNVCGERPCVDNHKYPPTPSALIPINTATNKAGNPVSGAGLSTFASTGQIAITPDGKTAYVLNDTGTVIPVSTATNRAGRPIHVGQGHLGGPRFIAITPDGKTVYVANTGLNTVTPVSTATNRAGKPIPIGPVPAWIVFTPDGKTAYVLTGEHSVIPISTATNAPGRPIRFGSDCRAQPFVHPVYSIAITPDGKTAYVTCEKAVIPISTATNRAGQPIPIPLRDPSAAAITP